MKIRPVMKGQTHPVELNIDGDRVKAICGDVEVTILPGAPPDVWVSSHLSGLFEPREVPNLIAALQRANDYLQGRG